MSVLKIKDGNNWVEIPASGVGVPQGGNAGDVLTKASSTDYDAGWVLPLSMKLLWTNPNPTSNFTAGEVQLSLTGYDFVMVLAKEATTTTDVCSFITPVGEIGRINIIWNSRQVRRYTVASTGVAFEGGYEGTYNGTLAANNARAIPLYIYGIKGIT